MLFLVLGCWEVGTWDPGMLGVLAAPAAREPTEPSCHLRLTKQREEREVNTATWVSLYLPQSINTSQGIALVNKNKTKKKKEMKNKNIPFIIDNNIIVSPQLISNQIPPENLYHYQYLFHNWFTETLRVCPNQMFVLKWIVDSHKSWEWKIQISSRGALQAVHPSLHLQINFCSEMEIISFI